MHYNIVNLAFIDNLLCPLAVLGDIDEYAAEFDGLDTDNPLQMKDVIKEHLLPFYEKQSDQYKQKLKSALQYFLTTNEVDFTRIIDSQLLPFDAPQPGKNFFVWIWEIFWPSEQYFINDLSKFKKRYSINEPYHT